jgi:Family of unknown function (DUF5684)
MEILIWFISATAIVFEITCISLVFTKADKPGWGAIIPIYGIILLCDIAGRPRWWTLLCLIPFVNILACIALSIGVARHFDRSDAFGVGLALVPVVFWAIIAFGDSEYDTYDSTERAVPAQKTAYASPAPRPVSRPQREAAPAPVRRSVPVCAVPLEVTPLKQEATPSLAESAVLAPTVPVPVAHSKEEAAPAFVEGAVLAPAAPGLVSRSQQDAAPAGVSVTDRPRIARCPSCRKVHVGVVEEAGIRRCGSCLAVLPSYIQATA